MYSAYITKVDEKLKGDLIKGLEFINWTKYIKKDSKVFLKPNFTYPHYKEGITTNPELLRDLLEIVKDRADNVILGESDMGNRSSTADETLKGHGMCEICRDTGVELVNLSKLPSRFVEDKIQGRKVKVQLPNLLLDKIDCFISVPVLKVHVMTTVTLSIKNLWGCLPDTMRMFQHPNFDRNVTLITKSVNPRIVVIDGIYGLNGHGPMYGDPIKMDLIITSDNPVVADSLGASIMGFLPNKIGHLRIAEKEGLGTTNLEVVRINRDWRQYKRQFHIKKTFMDRISSLPFKSGFIAKMVYDSSLTPSIYKVVNMLKRHKEALN
ncbi:DUF362 domain-containing protein [candidate division WOR-3 bacterium]|nr:DUF362 domain-containing protein [candidate division WOR-3 bacterium]